MCAWVTPASLIKKIWKVITCNSLLDAIDADLEYGWIRYWKTVSEDKELLFHHLDGIWKFLL